jgi:hypothetical protein
VTPFMVRAAAAMLCALLLAACVDSSGPILPDAQAVFGPRLKLQLYSLRQGYAHDPERATYTWNGALYAKAGGGTHDVAAFSAHPFESGDYLIQSVPANKAQKTEYALLRKLAEGAYLVIAVDEADADDATRTAFCKHDGGAACRIATRDQLFAFARATAARQKTDGGLAIRLPDEPEPPARRAPSPHRRR